MEKKIGKSVVATGIAATTIISGGLTHHQVYADDLVDTATVVEPVSTTTPTTSTEVPVVPVTPVSLDDVVAAQEKADAAKVELDQQQAVVDQAKSDVQKATDTVKEAQETVEAAKENKKEATTENIETAKTAVQNSKEEVNDKTAAVNSADTKVKNAEEAVKNQENVVAAQKTLKDVAESELNRAKESVHNEEQALETAKNQQKQAENVVNHSKEEVAKAEQSVASSQGQTDIQNKINQAQSDLNQTKQTISSTEAQLATEEQKATTAPVELRTTSYSQFLENLRNNSESQEVREAATNALALYQRGQSEFGISVNSDPTSPASLENNLQALELVKAVNAYRRNAGLSELVVDPFANVASQIQTVYFEEKNWHMGKLIGNENVAISFAPQAAVDFWHSEKNLYQQLANQYGLPTDETQIDANAVYMKVGATVFAKIGHYVQMMDNKANVISAAYDTHPNQWGTPYGTSEVGFHNVANLDQRMNNGTLLTVAALEQLIRTAGGRAVSSSADVTALKNKLAELNAQKVSQESSLNILNVQLVDIQNDTNNRIISLENARQQLTVAESQLRLAKQTVAIKEAELTTAVSKIADKLRPYQEKFSTAQQALEKSQTKLADLKSNEQTARDTFSKAQEALIAAKNKEVAAQKKLYNLENASELLLAAETGLEVAQTDLSSKQEVLGKEEAKLATLQGVYNNLQSNYLTLLDKLIQSEGVYASPASLSIQSVKVETLSDSKRKTKDKEDKETTLDTDSKEETSIKIDKSKTKSKLKNSSKDDSDTVDFREFFATDQGSAVSGVFGQTPEQLTATNVENQKDGIGAFLPTTGSGAERLAILGMTIGAVSFLRTNKTQRKSKK